MTEPAWRGQHINDPFAMTPQEMSAFLGEIRYAAITTQRKDTSMISVFMGYEWDGDAFYFCVRGSRLINQRLARDPRVSLAITNERYPSKYVIADGEAEIIDDPDLVRTKRMFLKYMSPQSDFQTVKGIDIDVFWANYLTVGRTMYRVAPIRLKSEDASKWPDESGGAGASDTIAREKGLI